MADISTSNNRIALNTVLLYIRTILVMLVSLYTSRVVLNVLGVEDYGVYQVVGGVVSMFAVISGALSTAISRFLTYGLGKSDSEQLRRVFSTSIIVQLVIALLILVLCEIVGVWFLNNKLEIPDGRMDAAVWVLHCSLIAFVINLISVPYNASIIAHEKMSVFAYISILEVVLKLVIVYALLISPFDKLISYAVLTVSVAIIIRFVYGVYCGKHFDECRGRLVYDNTVFKEMLGFAGWNFFSNGVYIFNNQGITMLVNMYFGVAMNAARGIATQVETAVQQFTNNFTTAINPQITKSYAVGDNDRLYYLVCKGAKFSFYLLFWVSLPILMETEFILKVWLKLVPEYAALFTRLAFISALVAILGNSCYTACLATGRIKKYTVYTSIVGSLVFFLTWLFYKLGGNVELTYYVYIFDWILMLIVKLYLTRDLTGMKPSLFVKGVIMRVLPTTLLSLVLPLSIVLFLPPSISRFFISVVISMLSSTICIYFLGLTVGERNTIKSKIRSMYYSFRGQRL